MAKRFRDTGLWDKDWYVSLSCAERSAFTYILDHCDAVGLWAPSFITASKLIGADIDWAALPGKVNRNIQLLANGKWWVRDFCAFQYGLIKPKSKSKVQQHLYSLLCKHGLWDAYLATLAPTVGTTVQEKEKEKEKEEDKELSLEKDTGPTLAKEVEAAFLAKNNKADYDYGKERLAVKRIVRRCLARPKPKEFAAVVIAEFWKLTQTGDDHWRAFPFMPRILAGKSWDAVVKRIEKIRAGPSMTHIVCPGCYETVQLADGKGRCKCGWSSA